MSAMAFYRRLRAAGVDEATALLCAEAFEQEVKVAVEVAVTAVLEPRRAKDRERKKLRNSTDSTENADSTETPAPSLSPPDPPKPTPTPVRDTTRAREDAAFETFWAAYPRKTAKADARKAFVKAVKKAPVAEIIGGLERVKPGWDDAQFIPYPATWLNGGRWKDEASEVIQLTPRKARYDRPTADAKLDAKNANYARAWAGSERAAGREWEP